MSTSYYSLRQQKLRRRRNLALVAAALAASSSVGTALNERRWWVRPLYVRRDVLGAYKHVFLYMKSNDEDKFFNYCRMTPRSFDILLEKLMPSLTKYSQRQPICPGERLAITLRYLASGDSMASLSYAYLVAPNTISIIILETCNNIWKVLHAEVIPTTMSPGAWKKVAADFNRLWDFPHCLSAIDGKHVMVQAPNNCGSTFYNYKKSHSIVLMAGADANYNYTFVDIGGAGRQSDGGIFANSKFGRNLQSKTLNLPQPEHLTPRTSALPYVFVADEAFPLKENIMRPFPGEPGRLPVLKSIFNYRLSRARRIIENTFGITAARWRILRKPIIAQTSTLDAIIKAVAVLHNYCQDKSNILNNRYCPTNFVDVELNDGTMQPGQWREEGLGDGLLPLGSISSNRNSQTARDIRDAYANYFFNEGQMQRQWTRI